MTNEEAMEMLTRLRDYEFVYREDAMEAHRMACEALEKQIPKEKVSFAAETFLYDGDKKYKLLGICPRCSAPIIGVVPKYCSVCGQALD